MRPRAGSTVREQDLKERKAGIHHILRDVASRVSNQRIISLAIGPTAIGCIECGRESEERPRHGRDDDGCPWILVSAKRDKEW